MQEHAGASVGNYALFAGIETVNAYDTSLTRSIPSLLSTPRSSLAGFDTLGYAVFAGGDWSGNRSNVVDSYDSSLTRKTETALSSSRRNLTGSSIGTYGLVVGGYTTSTTTPSAATDSYLTALKTVRIPITKGSTYNFNGTDIVATESSYVSIDAPATGYIKYKSGIVNK